MKKPLTQKKNNQKGSSFHHRTEPHSGELPALQRGVGSQRVMRSSQPVLGMAGPVQRKLVIGSPNDRYEQEADRVAEQVMRIPDPVVQPQETEEEEKKLIQPKPLAAGITPLVQRQIVAEEEKEHVQPKPLAAEITPLVQRQVYLEEEELKVSKKSAEVTSTNKIARSQRERRIDELEHGVTEIEEKTEELRNRISQTKKRVHGIQQDILKLKRKRIQSQVDAFEPDMPGKSFEQVNREIKNILVECQNLLYWEESEVVSQAITDMAEKLIPVIIKSKNGYLRSKNLDTALNYVKNIERYQYLGGEGFENGLLVEAVELLQSQPTDQQGDRVQRKVDSMEEEKEEDFILTKGSRNQGVQVHPTLQNRINSLRSKGRPLPRTVRNFFEPRFGVDFSNVQIHEGERVAEISNSLNARAFTIGRHIGFNSGEFKPEIISGKKLIAHELTHILQQRKHNCIGIQLSLYDKAREDIHYYGEIIIDDANQADKFEKEFAGEDFFIEIKGRKIKILSGTDLAGGKFICHTGGSIYFRDGEQVRKYPYADFVIRQLPMHIISVDLYQGLKFLVPIAKLEALLVMVVFRPDLLLDITGNIIAGKSIIDEEAMRGYLASTLFAPLGKIKAPGRIIGRVTEILIEATKSAAEHVFQEWLKSKKIEAGKLTEAVLVSTISSKLSKVIADLPVDDRRLLREVNDQLRDIGGGLISKEVTAAYETGKTSFYKQLISFFF